MWPFVQPNAHDFVVRAIEKETAQAKRRGFVDRETLSCLYTFLWMYRCRMNPEDATRNDDNLRLALGHSLANCVQPPTQLEGETIAEYSSYSFASESILDSYFLSVLLDDHGAEQLVMSLLSADCSTLAADDGSGLGPECGVVAYYRSILALAHQNAREAEEAARVSVLGPGERAGDLGIYTLAVREVLCGGDASGTLESLLERSARTLDDCRIAKRVRWAGWKGSLAPYLLDIQCLTLVKVANRAGVKTAVNTESIPRRLYMQTDPSDPFSTVNA
jgi:hypothetical protein